MLLPAASTRTELIEVVRITADMRNPFADALAGDDTALWDADEAREALALITQLPEGERQRCFVPGWGVRAHSATDLVFELAFCFRCHGARLWGPAVPDELQGMQSFDPGAIAGPAGCSPASRHAPRAEGDLDVRRRGPTRTRPPGWRPRRRWCGPR